MPRTTTTLYRIHTRVNQPREKILEDICGMAFQEGIQLDPHSSRCVWWGLERVAWAYKLLKDQQKKQEVFSEMLGSLK